MTQNGHTPETPTTGVEWRKPREQGYLQVLPSGNRAMLRPITPAALMAIMGEIPDHLTPIVQEMIFGGIRNAQIDALIQAMTPTAARDSLSKAAQGVEFANTLCKIAFVEPKVVDQPQADNEISPDDIELADRYFVLTIAMQPLEVLRSFRFKPLADVAPLPDSADVQPTPEQPSGDR